MRPPLVLLHGWGSSPQVWGPLTDALPGPPPLRLTLPGHGGSGAVDGGLDAWAAALLPGLPARFDLCGWSLGGMLAIVLAHTAPQRIRRLVLIGSTAAFVHRPDWSFGLPPADVEAFCRALDRDPAALMKRFHALQALGDRQRKTVLARLQDSAAGVDAGVAGLRAGLLALQQTDLRAILGEVACPVRLLHGQGDALMPVDGAMALADRLPEARLSVFDDCGHAPHLSRPAECAVLIDGFLDE